MLHEHDVRRAVSKSREEAITATNVYLHHELLRTSRKRKTTRNAKCLLVLGEGVWCGGSPLRDDLGVLGDLVGGPGSGPKSERFKRKLFLKRWRFVCERCGGKRAARVVPPYLRKLEVRHYVSLCEECMWECWGEIVQPKNYERKFQKDL